MESSKVFFFFRGSFRFYQMMNMKVDRPWKDTFILRNCKIWKNPGWNSQTAISNQAFISPKKYNPDFHETSVFHQPSRSFLQEQLNNELKELQEAYQKEKSQVPSKNRGINADTTDCYKVFYSRVLQQKAKDLEI